MTIGIELAERRLLPDPVIRIGIRRLLSRRLSEQARAEGDSVAAWIDAMGESPVALATCEANEQHYEVPAEFYEIVLGRHLKYSSAYWDEGTLRLDDAEHAMLELTAERAELEDGQQVLELGCGWGSLTLFMARRFPNSRILAVSNSRSQREWIEQRARSEGLGNLQILTADVNTLSLDRTFDRVVSVEMFEHVRNWEALLQRLGGWLEPDGRIFLHFFAHRSFAYPFETEAEDDWMGRHFFTGGMMPVRDMLERLPTIPFEVDRRWEVNGTHYAKTAEAWLSNLDANEQKVRAILDRTYGEAKGRRMVQRWRIFFLACAELFGFAEGEEWLVTHARLRLRPEGRGA